MTAPLTFSAIDIFLENLCTRGKRFPVALLVHPDSWDILDKEIAQTPILGASGAAPEYSAAHKISRLINKLDGSDIHILRNAAIAHNRLVALSLPTDPRESGILQDTLTWE